MPASKRFLLSAYCLLLSVSWSRHARPVWALSTLYHAHRAYRPFFVGRNHRDVAFLHLS
jgi:hypothetical protein